LFYFALSSGSSLLKGTKKDNNNFYLTPSKLQTQRLSGLMINTDSLLVPLIEAMDAFVNLDFVVPS
jgi:hypothetical protein